MTDLVALELSDDGLRAADAQGRLLPLLDDDHPTSPGFALVDADGRLQLGAAAARGCRRWPRQTACRFWDDLNTAPMENPAFAGYTHADLAYRHLERIRPQLTQRAQAVVLAVPAHYGPPQLSLLLGLSAALALPVRGLLPQALAVVPPAPADRVHLQIDLLLHRLTVAVIDCRRGPELVRQWSSPAVGLESLRERWIRILADHCVRATRFDPLHTAAHEQDLYDRLPEILAELAIRPETTVTIAAKGRRYPIPLPREALTQAYPPLLEALAEALQACNAPDAAAGAATIITVSDRLARLPDFVRQFEALSRQKVETLAPEAAARGALAYAGHFDPPAAQVHRSLIARAAPSTPPPAAPAAPQNDSTAARAPTHLIYRGLGYPIGAAPLVIGREPSARQPAIRVTGRLDGVSRRHCQVTRRTDGVWLRDTSRFGTFVDEIPVAGPTALRAGQTIRVGTPGETILAMACLEPDETPHD